MAHIKLDSKTARDVLKPKHEPYWSDIDRGFALGYRKSDKGGVWYARRYDSKSGKYIKRKLGHADDLGHLEADGVAVLSFKQARKKLTSVEDYLETQKAKPLTQSLGGYTVAEAVSDYMDWFRKEKKSIEETQRVCDNQILPVFGPYPVASLTKKQIQRWRDQIADEPKTGRGGKPVSEFAQEIDTGKNNRVGNPIYEVQAIPRNEWTDEMVRKRKSTTNRLLTVLKAVLNYAWREVDEIKDRSAWERVQAYQNVGLPKVRHLDANESRRLLNAADAEFRPVINVALLTGCRYGEIASLQVEDCETDSIRITDSKSGKPRSIPLTKEGSAFIARHCVGKHRSELVFTHSDGTPWSRSHQTRPMAEACDRADISPPIGFHVLRHTYATLLLKPRPDGSPGVPIRFVAEALGNSVAICEKHYAHVLQDDLRKQIQRNLPEFGIEPDNVVELSK